MHLVEGGLRDELLDCVQLVDVLLDQRVKLVLLQLELSHPLALLELDILFFLSSPLEPHLIHLILFLSETLESQLLEVSVELVDLCLGNYALWIHFCLQMHLLYLLSESFLLES